MYNEHNGIILFTPPYLHFACVLIVSLSYFILAVRVCSGRVRVPMRWGTTAVHVAHIFYMDTHFLRTSLYPGGRIGKVIASHAEVARSIPG